MSLSTSPTQINTTNTVFSIIPLDSNYSYYNKISGVFTVSQNTTIYTLLSLFNCRDSANVQSDQNINIENTPLIVATRIA
jgi:hypothetical protein